MDAVALDPVALAHDWPRWATQLAPPGRPPSLALVLGCALVALAAVVSRRIWPVSRTVVTLAHEGGHALVALLAGRRLDSVRIMRSTAGLTVSAGSAAGVGLVLTTAAGYTAPPLLGLGAAALLATGHLTSMLALTLAALAGLALMIRNAYGMLAVLLTGALVALVMWRGTTLAEVAFGYLATWFLLLGGVRPVAELQRTRRRARGQATDADQLARLTGTPGWLWVGLFGLVALAALTLGAYWLVPRSGLTL
jgi:peptidase M50B-like protein